MTTYKNVQIIIDHNFVSVKKIIKHQDEDGLAKIPNCLIYHEIFQQ